MLKENEVKFYNQNGYLINHSNDTIFNHQINGKKIR